MAMILNNAFGHQANLRIGRYSQAGFAYFVTKCAANRKAEILNRSECAEIIIQSLVWAQDNERIRLCGFVIMPNHFHAIVGLKNDSLSNFMASISKYTGNKINSILKRDTVFWQRGYYDHCLRSREDFDNILRYLHENPVRSDFVKSPDRWPYSSANPGYEELIDWDWIGHNV